MEAINIDKKFIQSSLRISLGNWLTDLDTDYIKNNKILAARSAIKSSREWPKNLGIGKPYQPDESIQNILMTYLDDPNSVTKLKMELEDLRKRKNSYSIILIEEIIKMMNTNE